MVDPVNPYGEYGVALRALSTGRNALGVLLFICVLVQVFGFLLARFTTQPYAGNNPVVAVNPAAETVSPVPAKEPAVTTVSGVSVVQENPVQNQWGGGQTLENYGATRWLTDSQGRKLNLRSQWAATYYLAAPATQQTGMIAAMLQVILIFLTWILILAARAPGAAHMTRSLISSVLLLFFVMPWQNLLPGFPIPGVLYSSNELINTLTVVFLPPPGLGINFDQRLLIVVRYVVWPVIALVVMLMTAERFRAGIRLAIGHPLQSMMTGGSQPHAAKPQM
jgi:hypothetical protein